MAEKKRKTGIVIFAYFVALLKKSLKSKNFGCFVFPVLRLYNLVSILFFVYDGYFFYFCSAYLECKLR